MNKKKQEVEAGCRTPQGNRLVIERIRWHEPTRFGTWRLKTVCYIATWKGGDA